LVGRAITKDLGRVMSRVKAIYRSWAIPCTGKQVYAPRHRAEWFIELTRLDHKTLPQGQLRPIPAR
jgi:hypothetical protein